MQLDMAVRAVQADYGDYPPDFSDWASNDSLAVDRWLLRAFPRYALTGSNTTLSQQMVNDILSNYKVNVANPAAALVVFLGGVPAVAGAYNAYSVQNPNGSGIPWRSDGFNADRNAAFQSRPATDQGQVRVPLRPRGHVPRLALFRPAGRFGHVPQLHPARLMSTSAPGWTRTAAPGATTTTTAPGTSRRSSPIPRRVTWRCTDMKTGPWGTVVPSGNHRRHKSALAEQRQLPDHLRPGRALRIPKHVHHVAGAGNPQMLSPADFDNITNFVQTAARWKTR